MPRCDLLGLNVIFAKQHIISVSFFAFSNTNKKFELMLTRRAKAYSSSGSVVELKIGVFTLSRYTNTKFSIWITYR